MDNHDKFCFFVTVMLVFPLYLLLGCTVGIATMATHYSLPGIPHFPPRAIPTLMGITFFLWAMWVLCFWGEELYDFAKSLTYRIFGLEIRDANPSDAIPSAEDTYRCSIRKQRSKVKKYRNASAKSKKKSRSQSKSKAAVKSTSFPDRLPRPLQRRDSVSADPPKSQQKNSSTASPTDSSAEEIKDGKAKLRLDRS